jgi:hypothetical protein
MYVCICTYTYIMYIHIRIIKRNGRAHSVPLSLSLSISPSLDLSTHTHVHTFIQTRMHVCPGQVLQKTLCILSFTCHTGLRSWCMRLQSHVDMMAFHWETALSTLDVHTPRERLHLTEQVKCTAFLCEFLVRVGNKHGRLVFLIGTYPSRVFRLENLREDWKSN